MAQLPIVSGKKAIKAFLRDGYRITRKKGSHFHLHHSCKSPLTIPEHSTIGKGLLRKLIRDAEL